MIKNIFNYTRDKLDVGYNLDNPARVDGEGNQIHLSKEIETKFPGKKFVVRSNNNICTITFTEDICEDEIEDLHILVKDHKENN